MVYGGSMRITFLGNWAEKKYMFGDIWLISNRLYYSYFQILKLSVNVLLQNCDTPYG